jgi:hypothetical protein
VHILLKSNNYKCLTITKNNQMKKLLIASCYLLFAFGCKTTDDSSPSPVVLSQVDTKYQQRINDLDEFYTEHVNFMMTSIKNIRNSNKKLNNADYYDLSASFFHNKGVNLSISQSIFDESSARIGSNESGFSKQQLDMLSILEADLATINLPIDAKNVAIKFRTKISSSSFTDEEKVQLFAASEYVYVLGKYFDENGASELEKQITTLSNGKVSGCSVNWRGAFSGGVASGVVGGVRGGMAGAAGGTVAIPGVGTATGAVGGAVFGFATGFVAGVAGGVIKDMIQTCGR